MYCSVDDWKIQQELFDSEIAITISMDSRVIYLSLSLIKKYEIVNYQVL